MFKDRSFGKCVEVSIRCILLDLPIPDIRVKFLLTGAKLGQLILWQSGDRLFDIFNGAFHGMTPR